MIGMARANRELGDMINRLGKQKKRKVRTPAGITDRNERGYIVENGLDREDAPQYRNDRAGFREKVNKMVSDNEMKALQQGYRYVNYNLVRDQNDKRKKGK